MIDPALNFRFEMTCEGPDLYRATWLVPADLPYFEGHFPGKPILPGVAILDLTLELLRSVERNADFRLKEVGSAKFLRPVVPGMKIEIELQPRSLDQWRSRWLCQEAPADAPSASSGALVAELAFTV